MTYKLFLDDYRNPVQCVTYMHTRIGKKNPIYLEAGWIICRNFECFKNSIIEYGLPEFISFDHDLAESHYGINFDDWALDPSLAEALEDTGYDCALWLVDYCRSRKLKIPDFAVHSMNPVGAERIFSLLTRSKREFNDRTEDSNREGV